MVEGDVGLNILYLKNKEISRIAVFSGDLDLRRNLTKTCVAYERRIIEKKHCQKLGDQRQKTVKYL